ncbi:hypothetical protein HMPREF2782_03340 [Anaerococcus sp. HMSC068A02]|nr:hypothetical protein HMPREF2782_03340 [Anaerococcus sp. HMSC068A02]
MSKKSQKLDLITGDAITPREKEHTYPCIFSKENIKIMVYPLETILAEKYETIIRRNISTTRMRDFYDLYLENKYIGDLTFDKVVGVVRIISNRINEM